MSAGTEAFPHRAFYSHLLFTPSIHTVPCTKTEKGIFFLPSATRRLLTSLMMTARGEGATIDGVGGGASARACRCGRRGFACGRVLGLRKEW